MKTLSEVAQAHRRAVMTPVDDADVFDRAVSLARRVRWLRQYEGNPPGDDTMRRYYKHEARIAAAKVREIALQSEILLVRRADGDQDHRVMLGVMLGSSL